MFICRARASLAGAGWRATATPTRKGVRARGGACVRDAPGCDKPGVPRQKKRGAGGSRGQARPGPALDYYARRTAPHRGFGRRTGRRNAKNKGFLASALRCYATRQGGGAWCSCFVVVLLHYWRGVLVLVRLDISEEKNTCLGFFFGFGFVIASETRDHFRIETGGRPGVLDLCCAAQERDRARVSWLSPARFARTNVGQAKQMPVAGSVYIYIKKL